MEWVRRGVRRSPFVTIPRGQIRSFWRLQCWWPTRLVRNNHPTNQWVDSSADSCKLQNSYELTHHFNDFFRHLYSPGPSLALGKIFLICLALALRWQIGHPNLHSFASSSLIMQPDWYPSSLISSPRISTRSRVLLISRHFLTSKIVSISYLQLCEPPWYWEGWFYHDRQVLTRHFRSNWMNLAWQRRFPGES